MLKNVDADKVQWGTVTVHLKDGTTYDQCDFPTQIFSEYERIVTFWWGGKMYNVPLDLVKLVVFNPPE